MKKRRIIEILLIGLIFIVLFVMIVNTPIIYKYRNYDKLIINEVMASNKNTLVDNNGKYIDYIEIYNGYDYDINMKGYYLSDDSLNLRKWVFPDVNIKANDYLVIYADGMDKVDDGEIHTNFRLDSDGEVLTLSDNNVNVLSRLYYEKTINDTTYGYNGSDYVYFYIGTPGSKNDVSYSDKPIRDGESDIKLKITEYSKDNDAMIEIYNDSNKDINMNNYYISNDMDNMYKYRISNISIKANDYLVIYADGMNKVDDGKIHTNFKLGYDDKILVLSDNKKKVIDKLYLTELGSNYSYGLYNGKWFLYNDSSFGSENTDNYITDGGVDSDIVRINEVSLNKVELKNLTSEDINLDNYQLVFKNGKIMNLDNKSISADGYLVIDTDGYGIDTGGEVISLYRNGREICIYDVGKLSGSISSGIDKDGKRVYYLSNSIGYENRDNSYYGYAMEPIFSINGGYVNEGDKITLSTLDDSEIYYTVDGSFPNTNSKKYDGEIEINKTMVIKAIAYKDGYINSDIVSRTFLVGRRHDVAVVSISSDYYNLFGYSGIISNFHQNVDKKISFELYEDGLLGTSFIGDTKISGMDSRLQPQKSMSVYLRKDYGRKEITYPLFNNYENNSYTSFLLRNAGEDPKKIRIMDAVLTRALKGEMDLDFQDYRPVVVYINGEYYGLYNLRDKMNADYVATKFGVDKDNLDLIKYTSAKNGSTYEYNKIVPTLDKRANNIVARMADIIGYSRIVTDKDGNNLTKLFMRGTPRYEAGSRFKYTPDYIDFSYDNLVAAISDAIDKQAQEDGKEFFTDKKNNLYEDTTKDLNFDELMKGCNDLIKAMIDNNSDEVFKEFYQPRIGQITDRYLGRGQKMSQCSREQVEALSLIYDDLLLLSKETKSE